MATINQSPAGQISVSLGAIRFNSLAASATPQRRSRRILVGSPSVAASFGSPGSSGSGGEPEPTTGQIWPRWRPSS